MGGLGVGFAQVDLHPEQVHVYAGFAHIDLYAGQIEKMQESIPERMLGDVKRVLSAALKLEVETSEFYEGACGKTQGVIKEVFQKLLEIERRHEDVVQMELDHASDNGYWFDFMEIDLEHG